MSSNAFIAAVLLLLGMYAGLHYYAYRKFQSLVGSHRLVLGVLLAILGGSVIAVEFLLHTDQMTTITRPLAWVSFIWMGLLFLFSALSAGFDVLSALARFTGRTAVHDFLASPRRSSGVAAIALLLVVVGMHSAHDAQLKTVSIQSPRLHVPIRMIQISDLHLGVLTRAEDIQQLVERVNALTPDLIFSTGDLVDMQLDHIDEFAVMLRQLHASQGKFAILGNHEVFAGVDASTRFIEKAGFHLLRNTALTIDNAVTVVGVDDPAVEHRVTTSSVSESDILSQRDDKLFTVLLKHQPVVDAASNARIDLQLSGHTHGGQIFPFSLLIHLVYSLPFGLSQREPDQWVYVSRGTGTWGPPMRILATPEITLIEASPVSAAPES